MEPLFTLIYASTATQHYDRSQLLALLQKARVANAGVGITGMLLHQDDHFFQVLEGPQPAVLTVFEKISADQRHGNIIKIIQEPIARRYFGDWTMACAEISRDELSTIDGLNDFFARGAMFTNLDVGRAKKLVMAFGAGRWHQKFKGELPHAVA